MEARKPFNPLLSVSTFLHQHCLRLGAELSNRLDDGKRFIGNLATNRQTLEQARDRRPLPFASLMQEPKHAFDVALTSDHVASTLAGTAVYTVSNSNNEFVLISDPSGLKSIGLLCFRKEDAEAFLAQVRLRKRGLRSDARVVPITLDQAGGCGTRVGDVQMALGDMASCFRR